MKSSDSVLAHGDKPSVTVVALTHGSGGQVSYSFIGTSHNYFTACFLDIPINNTAGQTDVPSPKSPPQMLPSQFFCQSCARQADSALQPRYLSRLSPNCMCSQRVHAQHNFLCKGGTTFNLMQISEQPGTACYSLLGNFMLNPSYVLSFASKLHQRIV